MNTKTKPGTSFVLDLGIQATFTKREKGKYLKLDKDSTQRNTGSPKAINCYGDGTPIGN